jgi:hypothetical protein
VLFFYNCTLLELGIIWSRLPVCCIPVVAFRLTCIGDGLLKEGIPLEELLDEDEELLIEEASAPDACMWFEPTSGRGNPSACMRFF